MSHFTNRRTLGGGGGGGSTLTEAEHYQQLSNAITTIRKDLDGYLLNTSDTLDGYLTVTGNIAVGGNIINKDLTQSLQTLRQALDGYTTSTGSTGDGYVAFFTGTNKIAGDNDLYWDRANNKLIVAKETITNYVDFGQTPDVVAQEGRVFWDSTNKTLAVGLERGTILQLGQEQFIRAKNELGVPITDGQVVRISGSTGNNIIVELANATCYLDLDAQTVSAVATQNVGHNEFGFFTTFGIVRDINTDHLIEGSPVYLSTTAGAMSPTIPEPPNDVVLIGTCVRKHLNQGMVLVNIEPIPTLQQLSNVNHQSPNANNSIIIWDAVRRVFDFSAPSFDGYTTSTGSAGDGYLAFFTGTNKIAGDNDLYWDRVNNRLHLNGNLINPDRISDLPTTSTLITAQSAYSQAATNVAGADLDLGSGVGVHFYKILSNTLGEVTVTTTVNRSAAVALLGGVGHNFELGSDDTPAQLAVTATNLAIAINANATLSAQIIATASTVYVYIQPRESCYYLLLATNQALRISVTNNNDGFASLSGRVRLGKPGTPTAGFSLGNGDVYCGGSVEVAGNLFGASIYTRMFGDYGTGHRIIIPDVYQTPDCMNIWLAGTNGSRSLLITDYANGYTDYAHPLQTNPTVFIQSATTTISQWLSLSHNQTDGYIATGTGGLKLVPANSILKISNNGDTSGVTLDVSTNGILKLYSKNGPADLRGCFESQIVDGYGPIRAQGGEIWIKESTAPSAETNFGKLYVKSADSKLYYKDDYGTEYNLITPVDLTVTSNLSIGGNIINKDLTQNLQTLRQACDGYASLTTQGADGYLAFFTGPNSLAGDNDLYWDRVNNRLQVNSIIDSLSVPYTKSDGTVPFTGQVAGITPTLSASLSTKGYVDSLQPMTALGDLIYGTTGGIPIRLEIGAAGMFLYSDGTTPAWANITEASLVLSNNTTNNTSAAKHGFAPKLSDSATQFLNGKGDWVTPSGVTTSYTTQSFSNQTSVTVLHSFGAYPVVQVINGTGAVLIPKSIVNTDANEFIVTFQVPTSGTIIATLGSPQAQSVVIVNNDYLVTNANRVIQCTASGKTITLPAAAGVTGREFLVDNSSTGDILVAVTGGGTIEGETSQTIPCDCAMNVYSDGSKYRFC